MSLSLLLMYLEERYIDFIENFKCNILNKHIGNTPKWYTDSELECKSFICNRCGQVFDKEK